MRELIHEYVRCGLIQFGNWEQADGSYAPLAFHLAMMPSFPKLLQQTAMALLPHFPMLTPRDRLMTTPDTIALGGVLATLSGLPMLYPRGEVRSYTAAFAIEGTADVGNPTILLTDVLLDGQLESHLITVAAKVGVPVHKIVALLDVEAHSHAHLLKNYPELEIECLMGFTEAVGWLEADGKITPYLAATLRRWRDQLPIRA